MAPAQSRPSGHSRGRRTSRSLVPFVAVLAAGSLAACDKASSSSADPSRNAEAKDVSLTIASNSIAGGKNAAEAAWYADYVIPKFTEMQKAKGVTVTVKFQPSGVDDEQYKAKMALDLKSRSGADIIALDGIWVGEFAEAGYIKPLTDVVGLRGDLLGRLVADPQGRPGQRVLPGQGVRRPGRYRRPRPVLQQEDLRQGRSARADWQPDELAGDPRRRRQAQVGQRGHRRSRSTPARRWARPRRCRARSTLLVGTGAEIYQDGKWQGNTQNIRDVLGFYKDLMDKGLMDKNFQQAAKGRDESFAAFAAGKIGILLEGDYFWRSVINPDKGSAPMATRDSRRRLRPDPGQGQGGRASGARTWCRCPAVAAPSSTPTPSSRSRRGSCMPVHVLARRHQGGAGRLGPHHCAPGRQQGGAQQGPAAVADLRARCCRSRGTAQASPSTRRSRRRCSRRRRTSSSGKSVAEAAAAYRGAVEKLAGGADKVQKSRAAGERPVTVRGRVRRRRARTRQGGRLHHPRLPADRGVPGLPRAVDALPRHHRLPAHRRRRGAAEVRGAPELHRAALSDPAFRNSLVAHARVRLRVGHRRPDACSAS